MRIVYIACPTNLTLGSANAIQTYTTLRELREQAPATLALVPRWPGEPSRKKYENTKDKRKNKTKKRYGKGKKKI